MCDVQRVTDHVNGNVYGNVYVNVNGNVCVHMNVCCL